MEEIKRVETFFDSETSIQFQFCNRNIDKLLMFNDKAFFYFPYFQNQCYLANAKFNSVVENFYPLNGLNSQPEFISFNDN